MWPMANPPEETIAQRYRLARRDRELVVIEGFHALKHALRFGAELREAVAVDPQVLEELARELAPDLAGRLADRVETVDAKTLADPGPAPVVLLEDPRNMGNIGACVRVAAAAGAAAVLTTGENDPWFPDAVRGAAGLHFALPVTSIESLPASDRPLLAIDPEGEDLRPG